MRADATRYFRDPELLTAAQHFKTKDHANTTSTGSASQPAVSPSERPAQSADTSQVYPPSH
jgi:hypothetical protein